MNPEDSASDETLQLPGDAFEAALVEHLLDETTTGIATDELVVVGEPPGWQFWQRADQVRNRPVLTYPTLGSCLDDLSFEHDNEQGRTPARSRTALVQLGAGADPQGQSPLAHELGESVRCFPHRLVVSIASETPDDAAFFAFGFRRLQLAGQTSIRLYEYSLSEYKQPPDWLNAKYWAHPERFDMDPDADHDDEDDDDED